MVRRFLYFSYGSNLNKAQMKERCPRAKALQRAVLDDHALEFVSKTKGRGVATVIPQKGESVPGGVWSITEKCLKSLDMYEGYPNVYNREERKVRLESGETVSAIIYFMTPGFEQSFPLSRYVELIVQGYKDFGISDDDLLKLFNKL
jgi:gamma-glutamylcyclotransferase (GGCT)/AIG2-like uncharacterized protein YtfP